MANDQFDTPPFKRLLNTKFSRERAQQYSVQMAYYVKNRRDCWGYVQGGAPLDVKRLIWEHEQDELIGKKSEGKDDHITLAVKEGAVLGLGAERSKIHRGSKAPLLVFIPGCICRNVLGLRPSLPRPSWRSVIPQS